MIKEAIELVAANKHLQADNMKAVFNEIMSGKASHDDMKKFLFFLSVKGETAVEIVAAAQVMREKMQKISTPFDIILDTCGTGGGESSFNVSTAVALVAAGAGVKVAKHGNRSYRSHCGSADVLEKMGVKIDISPDKAEECLKEIGMAFLFAPVYHDAMKHVAEVRKAIKKRTIFNILGPLLNPAGANTQVIGTFESRFTELFAGVLNKLGSKRAFVVHGIDGFDEISISHDTKVSDLHKGKVETYRIGPQNFGIKKGKKEDVACKTMDDNIKALKSILSGEKSVKRDMLLINASTALLAAGGAIDFKDGVKVAEYSIDSGKAMGILDALIKFTNKK